MSLSRWVAQADAALRSGCEGRESEMRSVFDDLNEKLRGAQELDGASEAERSADLRQQLETTRRQARWYEAEWHKARRRSEVLRTRLAIRDAKPERSGTGHRAEIRNSFMIKQKISLMRILWDKVTKIR